MTMDSDGHVPYSTFQFSECAYGIIIKGPVPVNLFALIAEYIGKKAVVDSSMSAFYDDAMIIARTEKDLQEWRAYVDAECAKMDIEDGWLRGRDTGTSSRFLFYRLTGRSFQESAIPRDASDFGRCVRMLRRFPYLKEKLGHIKDQLWIGIIESWDRLEEMYDAEDFNGVDEFLDKIKN